MFRRTLAIVVLLAALGAGTDAAGATEPLLGFHGDSMGAQARQQIAVRLDQLVPGFDQRIHSTGEPARDQDARQTRCQCSR